MDNEGAKTKVSHVQVLSPPQLLIDVSQYFSWMESPEVHLFLSYHCGHHPSPTIIPSPARCGGIYFVSGTVYKCFTHSIHIA